MDFSLDSQTAELRERTKHFIAEQVIPLEGELEYHAHGPSEL